MVTAVFEDGVIKNKAVNQTVTTTYSKKIEAKLTEFDITGTDGKSVPTDDVAKRLKAGGTLVLLNNPLDDTTRKHFAADTLFYKPYLGKARVNVDRLRDQLTRERGTPISLVIVKAKDGMLTWNDLVYTGKVVTELENGVPVTRAVGGIEVKQVAKEMKLAEFKITGVKGGAVAAADIEKRLKDGGVLVRTDSSLNKDDRKLFHDDCLFLEPHQDGAGRIRISSGPPEVKK